MEAGPAPSTARDDGYTGAAVAGAVLATLFFPFIALIAALLLQGGDVEPRQRAQLRTWAWISGGWLAVGVVMTALALVAL